jgi:hypothetical protein
MIARAWVSAVRRSAADWESGLEVVDFEAFDFESGDFEVWVFKTLLLETFDFEVVAFDTRGFEGLMTCSAGVRPRINYTK